MDIKDKEQEISISHSESVMDDFMKRLSSDNFAYDKKPTNEELIIDENFIKDQLDSYDKLLKSPIMQSTEEASMGPRLARKMIQKDNKK